MVAAHWLSAASDSASEKLEVIASVPQSRSNAAATAAAASRVIIPDTGKQGRLGKDSNPEVRVPVGWYWRQCSCNVVSQTTDRRCPQGMRDRDTPIAQGAWPQLWAYKVAARQLKWCSYPVAGATTFDTVTLIGLGLCQYVVLTNIWL